LQSRSCEADAERARHQFQIQDSVLSLPTRHLPSGAGRNHCRQSAGIAAL